jgi:hypothetical protein
MIIVIVVVLLTACSKNLGTYVQGTESLIPVEKKTFFGFQLTATLSFFTEKLQNTKNIET